MSGALPLLMLLLLFVPCSFFASAYVVRKANIAKAHRVRPNLGTSTEDSTGAPQETPTLSRRRMMLGLFTTLSTAGLLTLDRPSPAHATYSAYTHREQDWQDRVKEGNVAYSNSNDLRKQLRDIAPMNAERSKIFCPNGPSSNVSPLMENKCSDIQLAQPSVYGRSQDVVGNSIPGFSQRPTVNSATTLDGAGGFPQYSR